MARVDGNVEWLVDEVSGQVVGQKRPDGKEIGVVTIQTDPLTGGITKIWTGTQAQYDAIAVKDDSTLYVIVAG